MGYTESHAGRTVGRCISSENGSQTRLPSLALSLPSDEDLHISEKARYTMDSSDIARQLGLHVWPRSSIPYTQTNTGEDSQCGSSLRNNWPQHIQGKKKILRRKHEGHQLNDTSWRISGTGEHIYVSGQHYRWTKKFKFRPSSCITIHYLTLNPQGKYKA